MHLFALRSIHMTENSHTSQNIRLVFVTAIILCTCKAVGGYNNQITPKEITDLAREKGAGKGLQSPVKQRINDCHDDVHVHVHLCVHLELLCQKLLVPCFDIQNLTGPSLATE